MIAVVETEEFLADAKSILSEDEHAALVLYVAQYPEAGALITETGGLRKLRWASKGKTGWFASDLLLSQYERSAVFDGDLREKCTD
jgi:hypothetical protein